MSLNHEGLLYDYDFSYIPSAPFVEMTIASAFSTTPVSLNAFIDSGADATMIPFEVLQQLQAEEVETRYLRTVTGKRTVVDFYRVSVQIGLIIFRQSKWSPPIPIVRSFWVVTFSIS